MANPFKFKQFTIIQEQAAMKIGTDAVLLGAWAEPKTFDHFLDIGTGTGILALQLAQRFNHSKIDAIDIEQDAIDEALLNCTNSPWRERISIHHQDLENFIEANPSKYDFIICNPPYFDGSYATNDDKRNKARHKDSLDYQTLLKAISIGLKPNGQAAVIIPFQTENVFIKIAQENQLFTHRVTRVKGNINTTIKRSLIQISKNKNLPLIENTLVVEISRHVYTPAYIKIVKDFYLKMRV